MEKESSTNLEPVAVVWDARPTRDYSQERAALEAQGVRFLTPEKSDRMAVLETADVVLVHIEPFTATQVAALRRCRGIVSYGIGVDSIDGAAAAAAGIQVRNVPGYCTDEVADHALALLLLSARRLDVARYRSASDWTEAKRIPPLHRLRDRCVGIIGVGRIGSAIAQRCAGFGLRVIGYDPFATPDTADAHIVGLDELLETADIIVLACNLNAATAGLVNAAFLARLRPGAILVNVSRGGLVVEPALADALHGGHLAFAALDVRAEEPPSADDDPLADCPNLYLTPHVAASSVESVRTLNDGVAAAVIELLAEDS